MVFIYFHTRSSDNEPMHTFCPSGAESWCKYQEAVSNDSVKGYRLKVTLPPAVMDAIKPVFKVLSTPDLLKHCLRNHMQNPNENI